jgi:hypothetical protein
MRGCSRTPSVRDAVPAHCRPDGAHYADRLLKGDRTDRVQRPERPPERSGSDVSVRDHLDSRLCPGQVNVTINIAPVRSLLGLGDFANPMAAHLDYDDERLIGLITRGIGQPETSPVVRERCTWLEVGEDLR